MKVLYCSSVFLDYRIPFFKELNKLFKGDFYVMYSPKRYKLIHREDLIERIELELGDNAIQFKGDYLFCTKEMSFKRMNYEKGKKIPFVFGFLKAIRKIKPDVLITEGFFQWTPWVVLYSVIFKIPVFIGYERTPHTERNCNKIKVMHRKLTDKFISGYLVNGSETRDYLLSLNINPEKIKIVGMSADDKGLSKDVELLRQKSDEHGISNGIGFLFVGQIVERKGIKELLSAWEYHILDYPNDTLTIVGFGDMFESLKNKYADFNSVIMTGRVEYKNIAQYYAKADVFILPTLEDNWSLVVPEAMACGLPVCTTIYNGCHKELIKEGVNGFIFDSLDKKSMIDVLKKFHFYDLKSMGINSKEIEKEYNTENCALREYKGIISTLKTIE